jgi:hypothetical protein
MPSIVIVTRGESRGTLCDVIDVRESSVGVRVIANNPLTQKFVEEKLTRIVKSDLRKYKLLSLNKESGELPG